MCIMGHDKLPELTSEALVILERHKVIEEKVSTNLAETALYKMVKKLVKEIQTPTIDIVQCDCGCGD